MIDKRFSWVLVVVWLALTPAVLWGQAAQGESSPSIDDGAAASQQADPFLVFDGILLKDKPDLAPYGLKPITVLYHYQLWAEGESDEWPNKARLRILAKQSWRKGHLVCVDIEHWPLFGHPDEVKQASIDKLITVVDTLHESAPGLRLGYYAMMPRHDYWGPVGNNKDLDDAWKAHNEQMRVLADHVDVVFPSLYAIYEDQEGWLKHAEANIAEARKYGKQVYVFLWPWYHNSNKELAGQLIPADYWRLQLDTCRRLADGVVIWTDPYEEWDPDAPWWAQTRQFMAELEAGE